MIAELRPKAAHASWSANWSCGRTARGGGGSLSVGAKISYPVTAAVVTSLPETEGHTGCDAVRGPRPRTTASIRVAGDSVATTRSRE